MGPRHPPRPSPGCTRPTSTSSALAWLAILLNGVEVDDVHPDHGNTLGSTALHNTARQGDMAGVTLLLEHGANVGLENALGETPMDVAKNKEGRQLLANNG